MEGRVGIDLKAAVSETMVEAMVEVMTESKPETSTISVCGEVWWCVCVVRWTSRGYGEGGHDGYAVVWLPGVFFIIC